MIIKQYPAFVNKNTYRFTGLSKKRAVSPLICPPGAHQHPDPRKSLIFQPAYDIVHALKMSKVDSRNASDGAGLLLAPRTTQQGAITHEEEVKWQFTNQYSSSTPT
jgi:hypothetical protein